MTDYILFAIGLGLGATLFYTMFGFAAAYRNAIVKRQMDGVIAQVIMIIIASLLFAPLLANGNSAGAWAPFGLQVAIGSFLFGIGMQLGGACASGTLFSVGSGNLKMALTLLFFCIGAFIGSLHLGWWGQLPDLGSLSLGHIIGWGPAVFLQVSILIFIGFTLYRYRDRTQANRFFFPITSIKDLLKGPWPLIYGAVLLALLNTATLINAGHPWTVTWAFTLWGAKLATVMGWNPESSEFWQAPFQSHALEQGLLDDTTSMMNIALVIGAFLATVISGKLRFKWALSRHDFAACLIGGLLMGYGARLAYGCNIGALFSGMSSTSLHAWLWIICALIGTYIGIKLRPVFKLSNT